jgi:DNA-binding transcriptional LysR family regulator
MNYTLHQLQIFLKVAQCQSVTKAADELHLTQPAVSIQLSNFQDQFDIPITEVVGRKIYITDFGKEIATVSERIIAEINSINQLALTYQGQLAGKLKVSVVSTGKYVMPYFLSGFLKENPGVELKMDVTNKLQVVKSLESNEIDFALVSILPDHLNLTKLDLLLNELYLVGNEALALESSINPKSILEKLPLIFREEGSGTRQAMEKFILMNNLVVRKKLELTSNEAVKQAVLAGLGYSIMPKIGIRHELKSDQIKIIPVRGLPIKTKWQLVWLVGKKLSPAAIGFYNYLQNKKSDIVAHYFGV